MAEARTCGGCLGALRRVGARLSLACRWHWGLGQALGGLDDPREARELQEARVALQRYRAREAAAMADGRITATERAELQAAGAIAERELADLAAYDECENELHAEARHATERARAALAPLSRAADRAEAESYHTPSEALEDVWAGLMQRMEQAEAVMAG